MSCFLSSSTLRSEASTTTTVTAPFPAAILPGPSWSTVDTTSGTPRRHTSVPPIGASRAHEATDQIPSTDWDLCEIWHATSKDGFTWEEQEVAVSRPPQPIPGCRSVATPDILVWGGQVLSVLSGFCRAERNEGRLVLRLRVIRRLARRAMDAHAQNDHRNRQKRPLGSGRHPRSPPSGL